MDGADIPGHDGSGGLVGRRLDVMQNTRDMGIGPVINPNGGPGGLDGTMPDGTGQMGAAGGMGAAGIAKGEPNPNGPSKGADPFAFQKGLSVEQAMQAANDAAYGYNKHTDANYWRD